MRPRGARRPGMRSESRRGMGHWLVALRCLTDLVVGDTKSRSSSRATTVTTMESLPTTTIHRSFLCPNSSSSQVGFRHHIRRHMRHRRSYLSTSLNRAARRLPRSSRTIALTAQGARCRPGRHSFRLTTLLKLPYDRFHPRILTHIHTVAFLSRGFARVTYIC